MVTSEGRETVSFLHLEMFKPIEGYVKQELFYG